MNTETMLDPALIPLIAARFKALGEPGRLSILSLLHGGERSVSELTAATGRGQPNISQHLTQLARAGLVSARREGNRVFYRIADPHIERICDAVCDSLASRADEDGRRARALAQAARRSRKARG